MTWEEIKLATLQKMFMAEGKVIPTDESTLEYINAMPFAANEALQQILTVGKFKINSFDIVHIPIENILSKSGLIHKESGEVKFEGQKARSYSFEFSGVGNVKIEIGDESPIVRQLDSKAKFMNVKGLLSNIDKNVRLTFRSEYPFAVRNVALYKATFLSDDDIVPYSEYTRYHLPTLIEDFYEINTPEIYYEGNLIDYIKTSDYFQEGNNVLVLDNDVIGNYRIYYKAYPRQITFDTPNDYELPLDPEVAVLLPLYMTSQLYKDDDIGLATAYRNEFEVGFERLAKKKPTKAKEKFISISGWI